VVAKFKACLTRPVPAIVEPCAGVENDTAYSRAFETIELLLRPNLHTPKDPGYHRLRVLFQLEADSAAYADVQAARQNIQALAPEQQASAYLDALRRFAALDEIDLKPQAATATEPQSIFPEDPTEVLLADITDIRVQPAANDDWTLVTPAPKPVVTVRPSHIATATIQELLCGPLFTGAGGGGGGPVPPPAPTGPTVTNATLATKSITLTVSREIAEATLDPEAFSVTEYDDEDGWSQIEIKTVTTLANGNVKIDFKETPAGDFVRLIARGTGPMPLLAADDHVPLGAPGAGGADDGTDFVKMFKRS
jgi:hypothetical protein